ncbi:MAG TPA: hypothetical protein VJ847_04580 [Gemmatimonadales bacterium]|jgi:hypothetical protein|nr:hypothetical protein [Gemmatimonadales bacterium]
MIAPSSISTRRFPDPVRVELQVAYARAWEALTATHEAQAVAFVRHLRGRLGSDEALHRYFREVAVPMQMQETVRARALLALTPDERRQQPSDPAEPAAPAPYRVIEALRRRAQYVEETNLACRLAASVADEAVSLNHVAMALEVADVLRNVLPVDEALMHYIRAFELGSVPAQLVFQRALARIAELQPVLEDIPVAEPAPRFSRPLPRPEPGFGLRAIV